MSLSPSTCEVSKETPATTTSTEFLSRKRVSQAYAAAPGSDAEEELVRKHLSLVKSMVGRMAMSLPAHVSSDDLHSSALIGLLNAIRNYDPAGGSMFESYARVRIKGAMLDELRRMDWVPRSIHDKARKVQAVMAQQEQAKGRTLTNDEMAEAMGLSLSEYEELLTEIRPATFVCLDSVHHEGDDETSRYESVADEGQEDPVDCAARNEMAALIAQRIEHLPDMQKKVLALYYFEDLRLREIAEVFGVTESRICQIHSQAILAIRAHLQKNNLT
jgi:RNA polymerase sigma factor FliA